MEGKHIVVIGSGNIATMLSDVSKIGSRHQLQITGGREFLGLTEFERSEILSKASKVIFLAYIKTSPFLNLVLLSRTLRSLKKIGYSGAFLFLSTYNSNVEVFYRASPLAFRLNFENRYVFTKRLQERMVINSGLSNARVVTVPFVVGINGPHDRMLSDMSLAESSSPLWSFADHWFCVVEGSALSRYLILIDGRDDPSEKKRCFVYSKRVRISDLLPQGTDFASRSTGIRLSVTNIVFSVFKEVCLFGRSLLFGVLGRAPDVLASVSMLPQSSVKGGLSAARIIQLSQSVAGDEYISLEYDVRRVES